MAEVASRALKEPPKTCLWIPLEMGGDGTPFHETSCETLSLHHEYGVHMHKKSETIETPRAKYAVHTPSIVFVCRGDDFRDFYAVNGAAVCISTFWQYILIKTLTGLYPRILVVWCIFSKWTSLYEQAKIWQGYHEKSSGRDGRSNVKLIHSTIRQSLVTRTHKRQVNANTMMWDTAFERNRSQTKAVTACLQSTRPSASHNRICTDVIKGWTKDLACIERVAFNSISLVKQWLNIPDAVLPLSTR